MSVLGASAKVIRITEAEQAKEFFALNGGDTLVLAEGVWDDLNIKFKSIDGTRAIPVVFRGETAGKTILRGLSSLSFSGYGIVVEDLWFQDPITAKANAAVVQFRTSDAVNAYESVIRNVRMTGFNTDFHIEDQSQWLAIYGMRNIVENCSFEDKVWLGCTVAVFPETGHPSQPNHTIRNNYFTRPRAYYNENGDKINSQEVLRTSTYIYSMTDTRCLIENNMFEKCSGEIEYISIKSCNNTFRGNVFLECEGTLTLRHGNGNVIQDNYFDGRNVPGTGGIRIIGDKHIVSGNYMKNLAGSSRQGKEADNDLGYYSAVSIMMGVNESVLNAYYQPKDIIIENNVAINCYQGMAVGIVNRAGQEQPFYGSRVSDNVFISTDIAAKVFNSPAPEKTIWQNNVFEGGKFIDTTPQALGAVSRTAELESREMPVFDFGPEWKHMYE